MGVVLLALVVGAAALGFAAGGHTTSAPAAASVYLYWANDTRWGAKPGAAAATTIGRARLDGTGVEHSFVSGTGRGPCGVALDREHFYWGEALGGKVGSPDRGGAIGRANRDGSGVNAEFIPTPAHHGCGVAIAGSHIYWTSWACKIVPGRGCWWAPSSPAAIVRANVDGTGVDDQFITGLAIPRSPAFQNGSQLIAAGRTQRPRRSGTRSPCRACRRLDGRVVRERRLAVLEREQECGEDADVGHRQRAAPRDEQRIHSTIQAVRV